MNVDSNLFENWFGTTSAQGQQTSLWDKLVNAGGQVIDTLPDIVDGVVDSKLNAEIKNKTETTENITSTNPSVSGSANQLTFLKDPKVMYGGLAIGGIIAAAILIKALK
ncbi:TMhelix containing protein [Vibrio phage 1.125.O._10N.286.49.F5]|uniref:TMhelix containing protein n=1 Tax=Vibrio phage 1.125.O._10N.286.49.F5 TaxID=1881427 RepID=A0A2I7R7I6_9VIRU|nr:TMhelix containing protein [Vibrio phage 1.125.O._10N.286.49.F5]